jgi:hypothetical protein
VSTTPLRLSTRRMFGRKRKKARPPSMVSYTRAGPMLGVPPPVDLTPHTTSSGCFLRRTSAATTNLTLDGGAGSLVCHRWRYAQARSSPVAILARRTTLARVRRWREK